jgi:hypothetical protein
MGTQTNVKFSEVSMPIAEALVALRDEAFEPLQIELREFSRIQPTGEAALPGYDAVGKLLEMQTVGEVLAEVGRGESFALVYFVGVPAYIYLNFFEFHEDRYSFLLTFDSSILYFEDDQNEPGDVLERILTKIVEALDIDVCGYNSGDRYFGEFDALTVAEILDGLRSRSLLERQPPYYYAIKTSHISAKELRLITSGTSATYKLHGSHHILSCWSL